MNYEEIPFFFPCGGDSLMGIAAIPESPGPLGVLVLVGGPQYRVGSHRQFVHLSRSLAARGVACMRFDYHGMGDSTGQICTFEQVQPDTRAAVDAFFARHPDMKGVVLWGLCDGASAAAFYAHTDARVAGLVLLNPWVRTVQSEAVTYLRHYYVRRLFQTAFWTKLLGGNLDPRQTARSFLRSMTAAWGRSNDETARHQESTAADTRSLPSRMAAGLNRFRGRVLIILSGRDYTATEFKDVASASDEWKRALAGAEVAHIDASDHTFSKREWKEQVASLTLEWVSKSSLREQSAA